MRSQEIRRRIDALKARLGQARLTAKGETPRRLLDSLLVRLGELDMVTRTALTDEMTLRYEADQLRPIAQSFREFLHRVHPQLARPEMGPVTATPRAGTVLFTGRAEVEEVVRNALGPLGYTVRSGEGTLDRASNRWADAQDAEAGIFDFSDTDLARRAETAYLLGWAQALGMAVVLLRSPEKGLPFNAGHEPLVFSTPAELATTVEHRLARALFQPVTSSFDATAALRTAAILSRLYEGTNHEDIRNALNFLVPRDGFQDAYAVHDFAKYILSLDGAGAPTLLTPIWPPHYPQYGRRRVFHVFAYHREWSGPSRQAVERAAGLGYRAHIDTDSDDILASNWEELACANHVVVDISGFNDNVLIELGMAHALGRPVKLVGLEEVVDHLPQVIAKKRVETYSIQNTDPITEATLQLMAKPESLSIASAPWPC